MTQCYGYIRNIPHSSMSVEDQRENINDRYHVLESFTPCMELADIFLDDPDDEWQFHEREAGTRLRYRLRTTGR